MDINKILRKYKKTESEIIHDELFKTTSEYKYYNFGVAQGLYFIYDLMNEYKDKCTIREIMVAIKNATDKEDQLKDNFNRLIKDIK